MITQYTHLEFLVLVCDSVLDGLNLCGDHREYRDVNAVELIETPPGSTLTQAREQLAHSLQGDTTTMFHVHIAVSDIQ